MQHAQAAGDSRSAPAAARSQARGAFFHAETLDALPGFGRRASAAGGRRDAGLDAAWANELEQRQWAHGKNLVDKTKHHEETERLVANRAVSAYGEALPRRTAGDVFAPFAPRMH